MDKKTSATFLLCLMVVCMMSHAEALGKHPSKTTASALVKDTTWGTMANERTMDGLSVSGDAQNILVYAAHKREMKNDNGGGHGGGFGRKLLAAFG